MAGFLDNAAARRSTSSIARLSPEGREQIESGLADGLSYAEIIDRLEITTGEKVSRSALSRWRITDFEPTRRRIETARKAATELAGLLQDDPTSVDAKFNATAQGLFNVMLQRIMEAKEADLPKLMREARMYQQTANNLRRLKNDEQRIGIETERLAMDRRKLDQAMADFEARRAKAREAAQGVLEDMTLPEATRKKFWEALLG